MKIVFFNVNHCKVDPGGITNYFKELKQSTDIFCLQEAFDGTQDVCRKILPEYRKASFYKYVTENDTFEMYTLIRPGLRFGQIHALAESDPNLAPVFYTEILGESFRLHLVNFHGLFRPVDKLDSPEKLKQSALTVDFLNVLSGPKVIGGDFNLYPQTASIKAFEDTGYKNLIKEYGVKSTRNEVSWKKYPNNKQYFSDYVFVSQDIKVEGFEVPYNEFSDHLPVILSLTL